MVKGGGDRVIKCCSRQLMHWDTLKQDIYSAVRGNGEVGSARYEHKGPEHKGFMLQ